MAETTKIQWCHHTFNPWRGCAKVHAGCENCYAERDAIRFPMNRGIWGPKGTRVKASAAMWREPLRWNAAAAIGICPDCNGKRCESCDGKGSIGPHRRRVFCASLADVFEDWQGPIHDHNGVIIHRCCACRREWASNESNPPLEEIQFTCECGQQQGPSTWLTLPELRRDLFFLIDRTPNLDWLLVTKRPERIRASWPAVVEFNANGAEVQKSTVPLYRSNAWLLTSVSDQHTFDKFWPRLRQARELVPVLGVSAEPLLGPINFTDAIGCECPGHCVKCLEGGLDWIILGGESGPGARPCDVAHLLYGVLQCERANVACFVKQYGSVSVAGERRFKLIDPKGGDPLEWDANMRVRQFPETALVGGVA